MSDTLQAIREKYPQYNDMSDLDLVQAIGTKYPVYRSKDKGFEQEYKDATTRVSPEKFASEIVGIANRTRETAATDEPLLDLATKTLETSAAKVMNDATPVGAAHQLITGKKYFEPGKPVINIPRVPIEAAYGPWNPAAGAALLAKRLFPEETKGIEEETGKILSGLTTPGSVATLPLAAQSKPIQAYYALQMGAAVPESVERVKQAETPKERAAALLGAGANIGMTGLAGLGLVHGLAPKTMPPTVPEAPPVREPLLLGPGATRLPAPPGPPPSDLTAIDQLIKASRNADIAEQTQKLQSQKRPATGDIPILGAETKPTVELQLPDKLKWTQARENLLRSKINSLQSDFAEASKAQDGPKMKSIQDQLVDAQRRLYPVEQERVQLEKQLSLEADYPLTGAQLGLRGPIQRPTVPEFKETKPAAAEPETLPGAIRPPAGTPLKTAKQAAAERKANAAQERLQPQGGELEYIGTEAQRVSPEAGGGNRPVGGPEGQPQAAASDVPQKIKEAPQVEDLRTLMDTFDAENPLFSNLERTHSLNQIAARVARMDEEKIVIPEDLRKRVNEKVRNQPAPEQSPEEQVAAHIMVNKAAPFTAPVKKLGQGAMAIFDTDPNNPNTWIGTVFDSTGKTEGTGAGLVKIAEFKDRFLKRVMNKVNDKYGIEFSKAEIGQKAPPELPAEFRQQSIKEGLAAADQILKGKSIKLKRDVAPMVDAILNHAAKLGIKIDEPVGPYEQLAYEAFAYKFKKEVRKRFGDQPTAEARGEEFAMPKKAEPITAEQALSRPQGSISPEEMNTMSNEEYTKFAFAENPGGSRRFNLTNDATLWALKQIPEEVPRLVEQLKKYREEWQAKAKESAEKGQNLPDRTQWFSDAIHALEQDEVGRWNIQTVKGTGFISGTDIENWADQQIRKAGEEGRMFTGLDPELMSAYAIKGAALIERGIRNFAEWSAAMVKQYGEAIKPELKNLYNQALQKWQEAVDKGSRAGLKETEAAPSPALAPAPEEVKPGSKTIGITPAPGPLTRFIEQDVAPAVKKGVDATKAAINLIVDKVSPATRTPTRNVDVLFESKGYKEQVYTQVAAALDDLQKTVDGMKDQEKIDFIDRIKQGEKQPTTELQKAAELIRTLDDRLYREAEQFKPGLPYLENHLRVLWKVIPGSPEAMKGLSKEQIASKRPWRGTQGFARRHTLADMSEGIAAGGVPVTINPIEMMMLHTQDVMKFVGANRAWEALKKTGDVVYVKKGEKPPLGYSRINDSIAKAYFKTESGLTASMGEWWVEDGAARMINNYLSRDMIRGNPIGRGLLALKNATTAVELGMSPFHAMFESNEIVGSRMGLGIAKMFSGKKFGEEGKADFQEGLMEYAAGLKAIPVLGRALDKLGVKSPEFSTERLGQAAIKFAKNAEQFRKAEPEAYDWFVKKYPGAKELIDDLFAGGGQVDMHQDYRIRGIKGMKEAWKNDNQIGAVVRAVPALNEWMMQPLFETYIPRLKVGTFLREYSFELARNSDALASGKMTRSELARKTWAFIEDRFGELNWDNLYWNRTFKSAMQLAFRSVTWKLGNVRGFGKAFRDIGTESAAGLKGPAGKVLSQFDATAELGKRWMSEGRTPRITLPMAWLVGMSVITAMQATVISYLATEKWPWELAKNGSELLRNLVFPRIDPVDESQRVSIPTYWRDAVHLSHSPVDYVKSSMSGEWGRLSDVWQNRDFYGTEVYHPDDPELKQIYDGFTHLVPLPFGLSSYIAAHRTGATGGRAAAGFMGFTKAPYYISYSPAEKEAFEQIRNQQPIGSRTREQFQRGVNERIAVDSIKRGQLTMKQAIDEGLVDPKRAQLVHNRTIQTPLQHALKSLTFKTSEAGDPMDQGPMKIYEKASPQERKQIKSILISKIINSETLTVKQKRAMLAHIKELGTE